MTIDIGALNRMLDEFQPTVQKANDTPPGETVVATYGILQDCLSWRTRIDS